MFTNWLTGTTGGSATNQNPNDNRIGPPNSMPPNNGHILMSTPPDVILEVGSVPSVVRFVAHSIVLGMHSGYLRSAIRLDERATTSNSQPDFVLYLGNVTAEQFAPLLTYMYTGYLDLNMENIFGVLLATHVLHMPRALEICRAFLARAQTEGYLGARMNSLNNGSNSNGNGNGKIIRPIPSKPALPNFGFLPAALPPTAALPQIAQQQQQLLPQGQLLVNFKALQRPNEHGYCPSSSPVQICDQSERIQQQRAKSEEIDVDQESIHTTHSAGDDSQKNTIKNNDADDDEDEEVFIDSSNTDTDNDDTEVIIECRNRRSSATREQQKHAVLELLSKSDRKVKEEKLTKRLDKVTTKHQSRNNGTGNNSSGMNTKSRQYDKRRTASKLRSSSGLQIAKAPIPASQLDVNEGSKVIIDVASCDGPVRFRRILNTAYGHKPEDFGTQMPERSQQSVSYSFHQQMARTINQQQRQQMQQQSGGEESENSESSGSSKKPAANVNAPTEIYVCVYCKHTFKSQYCYQKHAKRHLNPLSLSSSTERCGEKSTLNVGPYTGGLSCTGAMPIALATSNKQHSATELLRREVRPLDMNVQYYPCKTCGSKFPSYYFVHKHRKLCHADEEAVVVGQGKDNAVQRNSGDNAVSVEVVCNQSEEQSPQQPREQLIEDSDLKKANESDSKMHEN